MVSSSISDVRFTSQDLVACLWQDHPAPRGFGCTLLAYVSFLCHAIACMHSDVVLNDATLSTVRSRGSCKRSLENVKGDTSRLCVYLANVLATRLAYVSLACSQIETNTVPSIGLPRPTQASLCVVSRSLLLRGTTILICASLMQSSSTHVCCVLGCPALSFLAAVTVRLRTHPKGDAHHGSKDCKMASLCEQQLVITALGRRITVPMGAFGAPTLKMTVSPGSMDNCWPPLTATGLQ